MASELIAMGWDVTLVAADFRVSAKRHTRRESEGDRSHVSEDVAGVRFLWLWSFPYFSNDWRRGLNWLTFAWQVLRVREQYDLIIGSSPQPFAALAAQLLAARRGVPFVLELRDIWPESLTAAGGRKGPLYFAIAVAMSYLYKTATKIVVLAKGSVRYLVEKGIPEHKVVCVPNGVDTSLFAPAGEKLASTPSSSNELRVLYAGAHGPANGLDRVLEAAAVVADDTGIRFVLVGSGPDKSRLIEEARRKRLTNVEFRDPVQKADVPALMRTADVGLMVLRPSKLFSFGVSPNKLFDYFAASLPVVCNVQGEVAAIVEESGGGVVTSDSSAEALAAAIRTVRSMKANERIAVGAAGRRWVSTHRARPALARMLDAALTPLLTRPEADDTYARIGNSPR